MTHTLENLLDEKPLSDLLGVPEEALDAVMATAFQLYKAGRYAEAEILCKGLVAANSRYGWTYSLYAAVMQRQGRLPEALALIEAGLKVEPNQQKLLKMRSETQAAIRAIVELAAKHHPGAATTEAHATVKEVR